MARLHAIDGTFELFRAHYSKRPDRRAPNGAPAKATVGVLSSLLYLLQEEDEAVTHLGVAFDNPIESWRNDRFAGYKTGYGIDPDLSAQFDLVEAGVRAMGVTVWSMDRWEADDALATAAARFGEAVEQVRILTPDKDLGQCIRGDRIVQIDRLRKTVVNEDALRARRGFGPESIPDFLALVGDTADGIPGLPRFGEKTAGALLGKFVHLEDIPRNPRLWPAEVRGADVLAVTLAQSWELALLFRELATLVRDVPLKEGLADLEWQGVPRAAFLAFCEVIGSQDLAERPKRWRV